jgi:hypothetical protein
MADSGFWVIIDIAAMSGSRYQRFKRNTKKGKGKRIHIFDESSMPKRKSSVKKLMNTASCGIL